MTTWLYVSLGLVIVLGLLLMGGAVWIMSRVATAPTPAQKALIHEITDRLRSDQWISLDKRITALEQQVRELREIRGR
jgi:hypothetical protein